MRKNDNGKLIYLLVGVIGVLVVVFQLKTKLYAAELDSTIITSAQAESMTDAEIINALVSEDENIPDAEIIEGDYIDSTGVYYANEVTADSYDDTVLLDKLDDILVELRKPSIDYRPYLGQIQYSLTGSFEVPYPSDLPYSLSCYVPSLDKTVLICTNIEIPMCQLYRNYTGRLTLITGSQLFDSLTSFETYYLADGIWVSTPSTKGPNIANLINFSDPMFILPSDSPYFDCSLYGTMYTFKLNDLNDSHTVIYYFTTIVPLLCVLTCVFCFVEIYRTSKMIRKKFIGGED